MKKFVPLTSALLIALLVFSSWGTAGHHAIGQIAQNHLSETARTAVMQLFGTATLADVSTYADEIRSQPEYKYTAPWHYINLEPGYDFERFSDSVKAMPGPNVYTALLNNEQVLKDANKTRDEKIFALKWIVHLVGDLHQPMHVSQAGDKGGNAITVTFGGKPSNLHRLWDSDLLEHQGYNFGELAQRYDRGGKGRVRRLQQVDVMHWLFESYQISEQLYKDAAKSPVVTEKYYRHHRKIIRKRVFLAGVRLAGVLNDCFAGPLVTR